MPEVTVVDVVALAVVAILSAAAAWIVRGMRCAKEKRAVNAGWKDQSEAQKSENDRLLSQNTSLMQQVNQYQASNSDARARSRDLADALREATEARDGLQRQLKETRSKLERATSQRDALRNEAASHDVRQRAIVDELNARDERIARLRRDVENWHERVPPLVERYRLRDREAQELEAELERARARITELEGAWQRSDETRLEPMDAPPGTLDASNDQYEETSHQDMTGFDDQPLMADGFETYPGSYSRLDGAPPRDDLKRIRGVGPAIEKILNELGFYRFDQIANLTHDDIARISERLHGFGSRIERDDWAGQARTLQSDESERP